MIFPPFCPVYNPAVHELGKGAVMFAPPYIPAPGMNPQGIVDPINCIGICDRVKTTGECCIPKSGCFEKTNLQCGDNMFFPYAADDDCKQALTLGLCGGPP